MDGFSVFFISPLEGMAPNQAARADGFAAAEQQLRWAAWNRRRVDVAKVGMIRWSSPLIVALVFAGISAGCASTGKEVAELEPGMAKEQVLEIMGPPNDRSFRGPDEAWQYQEIAGFGQCKYTTVWISDGRLVGISTRRGASVAGCGLGSEEVDWSEMPAVEEGNS